MTISPELLKTMQGGNQTAGAGMPPPSGPVSAPMSTPQENEGEKMQAKSQVQMAIKLLEQAIAPLGSDSDEGQAVLDAIKKLGGKFGKDKEKSGSLVPSEIMNLVSSLPKGAGGIQPPGAPPPAMTPPQMH